MPTIRPRHTLTETDEITRALHEAAEVWPEDRDRPRRLLLRLIRAGWASVREERIEREAERRERIEQRLAAAERLVGTLRFAPDHLERLREDWDR